MGTSKSRKKCVVNIFCNKVVLLLQAQMELVWAMKAHHQAETYFKVSYFLV